eukprot:Plantae.Rhodophyta-Hildenbrandia_rubra.ctg10610.p1 GENE.Plantae.Rhodophyta-Hildenbrandia_rubra.ctg10610~~Plantae.Rhodophyta-Hildenbrandia_rubra.ctg10610.p1  ORF type:complete len:330 (+),score=76.32 Plantae.Rhodophyta-Hildenbrandia_rubra.ctg10610:1289-2278(+)
MPRPFTSSNHRDEADPPSFAAHNVFKMVNLSCRMYENEFPEPNDIVMVLVKERQDMGAYVHLLEYNNCQGMIMFSELSRRRIRSINKVLGINKQEVAAVVRVDKEKGYIDLSKRRVAPEDIERIREKWNKSRAVHSIVRNIAKNTDTDMEELYKRWGWPLYKKYGHAYDAFKSAAKDPEAVLEGLDITPKEKEELMKNIEMRLTPQPIKMRADVEVTCFRYEGIDAIKAALKAGESVGSEECPIKVKLVAPPLYVITTTSLQKQEGIDILNTALDAVKAEIGKRGGKYVLKAAPKTVSDKDDQLLSSLMAKLEDQNKEVAGDDDSGQDN